MLENKTVGFVALVRPQQQNHPNNTNHTVNTNSSSTNTRIILGWAESGHGAGRSGDLLDAPPSSPVLPNHVWTRRVVRVGERCLGLNMARVFDSMGAYGRDLSTSGNPGRREALRGVFLGSHVEAKLALFAVCLLLRTFGLADDMDRLSARQLAALRGRGVVWQDGSRPVVEVYFSRKNCAPCGRFVEGLRRLTGVGIELCWRDRLTRKVYGGEAVKKALAGRGAAAAAVAVAVGQTEDGVVAARGPSGEVIVLEDVADNPGAIIIDGDDEDECCVVDDMIDLVADSSETGQDDDNEDDEDEAPTPAHAYADGLAYCVGQIDQEPRTARTAVVDLAQRLLGRPRARGAIDKPLPATPVTEFPGMLEPAPTPRFGTGRGVGTGTMPAPQPRGQRQVRGGAVARMQGARRHTLGGLM